MGSLRLFLVPVALLAAAAGCERRAALPSPVAPPAMAATAAPAAPAAPVPEAGPTSAPPAPDCVPAPESALVAQVRKAPYLAKGDGIADDTAAIQRAIDAIAGTGGTVKIPDGTYLINPIARDGRVGLVLGSRMTLSLSAKAVLKAMPVSVPGYAIVSMENASKVNIVGGAIQGERAGHQGMEGEWGMGLRISGCSAVRVQGITVSDCWGDGFYIAKASSDLTFCAVVADGNRRQGMSIVGGVDIVVRNSTFRNTVGTEPAAGLDVEPNSGETVTRLQVRNCTFTANAGGGIAGGPPARISNSAFFNNSELVDNVLTGNGGYGIGISACSGNTIRGNVIRNTRGHGIYLRTNATGMTIRGNTITGSTGDGIYLEDCSGSQVDGNIVKGNRGKAIRQALGCGAIVGANET